ncbi:MAG: toxic anion resistance protein [Anaerovoracaceae bacterium]|nr:toxic anion resistance protein [Anaerovoracaceae bacterium]
MEELKTAVRAEDFTPEEQQEIAKVAESVDLTDTNAVIGFGAGAQKKLVDFSADALNRVRAKDLGETGDLLTKLTAELRGFGESDAKGLKGIFRRGGNSVARMKAKYAKAETDVDQIAKALESHQIELMKDTATLDKMYDLSRQYFRELNMYIAAGKQRLDRAVNEELPAMRKKAADSGLPEDAQAAGDFANMCDRFEKKIHDLELTRTVSLQMAPQIRLVQSNDAEMSEKIQSTLVNTLPLWKNQMTIALGIAHSQEAAKAQRQVTDATNKLLQQNADSLKQATIETAKESERGIVEMETLRHTNESLISTLEEVLRIQEEGHQKRVAAEEELVKLEAELKEGLLRAADQKKGQ